MSERRSDLREDAVYAERIASILRRGAEDLDGRTRSKLTQARHAALAQLGTGNRVAASPLWRRFAPAGAVAAVLLATLLYVGDREVRLPAGGTGAAVPGVHAEDFEMLANQEAYEFSADEDRDLDSDFYEWAAGSAGAAADGSNGGRGG